MCRIALYIIILVTQLVTSHTYALTTNSTDIKVLVLEGNYSEMGYAYGEQMQSALSSSLEILKKFYVQEQGIKLQDIYAQADLFYRRFPLHFQQFIQAMAHGAHISLNDAKVLNAMETLGALLPATHGRGSQCAFLALPGNRTLSKTLLIGRNYDFSSPYDKLARFLTVTILKPPHAIPTAIIALAGEIYCPTCVNARGIFLELNNGMPSGGYAVNTKVESLLIRLLTVLQSSETLDAVGNAFKAIPAVDYSLIINAADKNKINSYEFSTTKGMKEVTPSEGSVFASTNYYLNPTWNAPRPSDHTTWLGVTRRNHLLQLGQGTHAMSIQDFEALMNKNLRQGGAVWSSTIYQIIFDPSQLTLHLKINQQGNRWQQVSLAQYF